MTTNLDLLKTIYNATISLPIKQRINPEDKKSAIVSYYYCDPFIGDGMFNYSSNEPYCKLNEKVTYFSYNLPKTGNMKYKYNIELYKTEPSKLLGFVINKGRYILRVQISEPTNYSTNFRNEYFFDSDVIKTPLVKDIFNFLMNRNIELTNLELSEKFELYVNDLSKSVDKSVTREETLNKILEK
jgi:hypothetical protein